MIDVFELYTKVAGVVNIHQNGMIKPNRQFIDWVNDVSFQLFEEKYLAWQKTQKITDDMAIFLRSVPIKVTPKSITFDLIAFDDSYGHISSARFYHKKFKEFPEIKCKNDDPFKNDDFSYDVPEEVTEQEIEIIDNARWGSIFSHKTKKPALTKPYMTQFDQGFKIAPKGIAYVVVDFFRKPVKATFDYTLGAGDQIIYNANTSVKLEWPATVINEFINRAERKFGKFTRDSTLYQMADKEIITTP